MAFHTPGGGEVQLMAYFKALNDLGIEVDLFSTWSPNFLDYDIVHYFSCIAGSSHFCNFVKKIGIPLVVSSSLWVTDKTKHIYPVDEIRMQLSIADRIITNSNEENITLSKTLNLSFDKFSVVYNGVDPIFFESANPEIFRSIFNIRDSFVLNVGNIEPRKNQLNLVKAMKSFPMTKLVLIGHIRDDGYAEEVFRIGGEQVKYVEYLDHGSLPLRSAYAGCDVFCLPSILETPGLAALEASCSNINNIAITWEGCAKEYFGEGAAYLDPNSVESISYAIYTANNNKFKQRKSLESVKSWKEVTGDLIDVYKRVIDDHADNKKT